jgi:peptidoglycan DL-endopeptidase RipA
MPRRARLFVFLGLAIALVCVTGVCAGAAPDGSIREKEADVADAQDRLMEIRIEASAAEASYNNALYEMNQLNGQITRTTDDLKDAKGRLAEAKKRLEVRAAQVYKSGNLAFMDVLVGVDNFSEFASRLDLWVRLLDRERTEFLEFREARNELAARRARLEAQREQRVDAVDTAIAQKQRANKAETQAEAYLNSLNAELRDAIQAAQDRQAAQARAAAAAKVEKAAAPEDAPAAERVPVEEPEPEPIPEVQVSQVKQDPVPRANLQSEQAAAEREAAAQAAAERAKRLAQQRAAERQVARQAAPRTAKQEAREKSERQAAREEAERKAEQAARRAAIEEAAAEQAAAERQAARRAAERRAEQRAADRRAEERAAEASASASAAEEAAATRAAERRAEQQAEAGASASAAAEKAADRRAEERVAEASASTSASASASSSSQDSRRRGGGRGDGRKASSSASATASASSSASGSSGRGALGGGVGDSGGDVLAVAQEHLGTPYVASPPGPCSAFKAEDCSCFTMLVFQEFGIALPDSPGGQMGYGTPVNGAPQAGDLLFWSEDNSGYITHVGIAMGDGTTIHASIYTGEVTITGINYVRGYVGARRLL